MQICDLTSLDDGGHFYRGYMNNLRSFGVIHRNALFKRFVAFLRKDGTKNEENLKEEKKTLTINSRVFLAIKSLTQS